MANAYFNQIDKSMQMDALVDTTEYVFALIDQQVGFALETQSAKSNA